MAKDVVLPLLGLTMEKGAVASWAKEEGDVVTKGDVLFEVETDKATQEVEAQVSGFLAKILADIGDVRPVGTIIALIAETQEELEEMQSGNFSIEECIDALSDVKTSKGQESVSNIGIQSKEKQDSTRNKQISTKGEKVPVSPAARRVAAEHDVDLAQIAGSGPRGRIMKDDVLKLLEISDLPGSSIEDEYLELTAIRRLTAERMSRSFQDVPHFYLSTEIDASGLADFRRAYLDGIENETGARLSYTDLLIKCLGLTLRNHPLLNAVWNSERIKMNESINISLATDTEQGLTVPVIGNADTMTLGEITEKRNELVQKALKARLTLNDLSDGTFTLTNLGMFDIDLPQAIINPPQAAILATGSIKDRATVWEGQVHVRPTMHVTLSVDHRVVDGVAAARFLQDFKQLIEQPETGLIPQVT